MKQSVQFESEGEIEFRPDPALLLVISAANRAENSENWVKRAFWTLLSRIFTAFLALRGIFGG